MKKNLFIVSILSAIFLTACSASNENIKKATSARDSLTMQKELAESVNGKLTVNSYEDKLSELLVQYNAYMGTDFKKLNNNEIQTIITDMDTLSGSYSALLEEMNSVLESDEAALLAASKNKEIICYISNNSGSELNSIILRDNSLGTDSGNLLSANQTLPSGRILAGVTLPVNSDSAGLSLIVTDTMSGEYEYPLSIEDINSASESGISITLGAPENGAVIGSYSAN